MTPNDKPYRRQDVDLPRLQRYARRVAGEADPAKKAARISQTEERAVAVQRSRRAGFLGLRKEMFDATENRSVEVELVPPHWVLFSTTYWNIDDAKASLTEYNEQNYWVLTEGGDLLVIRRWEETKMFKGYPNHVMDGETTAAPMSVEKILELDHQHPSYDRHHGSMHFWGNREAGKLIRHAPGVGLSLALKGLTTT
ncbi:hypothetical protein [Leifsonia sp. Leaf264]|uniref:hypothetical protein n=1 Tax=Leifsonia sp. Leaf264 TaxID=1736314 RepID=UPI0006FDA7A6|nr:hypothetical protein [Leifsonia sp. Leaf264]KQO98737.1 hypothetical protein ASF30_11795 [Leifsonia sp. Leaf264]